MVLGCCKLDKYSIFRASTTFFFSRMWAARFSYNLTFMPKSFTDIFKDRSKFVNLYIEIYMAPQTEFKTHFCFFLY
jgi:hypothetical protein